MDVTIHFVLCISILLSWKTSFCICSRNLALNKPSASDSSLHVQGYPQWNAELAVDGNRTQNVWCGRCLHTIVNRKRNGESFLRINLEETSTISRVEIYYRVPYTKKCNPDLGVILTTSINQNHRFKGYRIEVSDTTGIDITSTCYQDTSQPYPDLYQNNTCNSTGQYVRVVQTHSSEHETLGGPLLELCEVEVYGCPKGKYGTSCTENCSVNCVDGICEPDDGICRHGCVIGKEGDMCGQDCTGQTFGKNCAGICNCFNGVMCNSQTGVCPGECSAGWQGLTCSQECDMYYYGQDCMLECSDYCKDNAVCHHVNGSCLTGCDAGYRGNKCDQVCQIGYYGENCAFQCGNCYNDSCRNTDGVCLQGCDRGYENNRCTKECDDYKYGYNCNETCGSCRNNAICNKVSGVCPNEDCEDGYRGKRCRFTCLRNTYGRKCAEICGSCKDGVSCDAITGNCTNGCDAGWQGLLCKTACSNGTYGVKCSWLCGQCLDGEPCDKETGICSSGCDVGYFKEKCEKCKPGKYGLNCTCDCGHCLADETCNHVTGDCPSGCEPGKQGTKCTRDCDDGRYGLNCTGICGLCDNGVPCDKVTGHCLNGCDVGKQHPFCLEDCSSGYFGKNCNETCGNCFNNSFCDIDYGDCPVGCDAGFTPPQCKEECLTGKYGLNCTNACGQCLANDTCDHVTGVCPSGCEPGVLGSKCTQECDEGTYGFNCSGICGMCDDGVPCDKVTGHCLNGCIEGKRHPFCSEDCAPGQYGKNCSETCGFCHNNSSCKPRFGECPMGCEAGFYPPLCITECDDGTYGSNCSEVCGMCDEGLPCDKVTGHCGNGCIEGRIPPFCIEECPKGEYGKNCNETCGFCFNNSSCSITNGECPMGCQAGFYPPLCKTECSDRKYGVNCSLSCGHCSSGQQCNTVTGVCPSTCMPGYQREKCDQVCSSGWWGQNCANRCSTNCYENATCNNEDGVCTNGCEAGYKGIMCTEECGNGTYGMNCEYTCGQCKNDDKCHIKEGTCSAGCADGWRPPYCAQRIVQPPSDGTAGIIGGLLAALILVAIVLIIFLFVKRRRRPQNSQKHEKSLSTLPVVVTATNEKEERLYVNSNTFEKNGDISNMALSASNVGIDCDDNDDDGNVTADESEDMYTNTAAITIGKTDMLVNDLRARVSEKKKNDTFKLEFSNLVTGAVKPHEAGKDPMNKSKNRFLTTFPYDHSLVPLSTGEYINANYIDGVENKQLYIATQGPKSGTMGDFWRMAWENETGKVIMLANVMEMGKKKCEQYWPAKQGKSMEIEPFQLTLKEERMYGAYSTRIIDVKNKEKNENRNIHHFHFTTWPDHGVPDALQFVNFEHNIQNTQSDFKGPSIVHCSAGIGRTGTYIAFEELLKRARKHKNVDVFEFVKSMRENRMNMIQTLEQYVILHEALVESCMLTNTSIAKEEFSQMRTSEMKFNTPKNEQRCRREFQKLLSIRPVTDKASKDDALSKDNKSKNRTLDVIPLIKHRPYLFSHVAKRTSYINAVMLPTLRAQVGMIATQYPTQDTVQDFWCLIHDQESPNVVILEPNKEEIQLFPNGEESDLFGNIYVQQTSIDETKGANERKLSLLKKDTEEARQIDVFECLSWSWQEKLPTSSSVLLKLINRVFEWRDFKKTTYPITIVCFDGATKCGLFCSLFNTLEYLVEHGDVDVPRSVRQLQIRRPEFMTNIDQYEMVYEAVHEYLEQSSIYANT